MGVLALYGWKEESAQQCNAFGECIMANMGKKEVSVANSITRETELVGSLQSSNGAVR